MSTIKTKKQARLKRKKSIRKKISGTPQQPRLSVFRSGRHIYAQIIDDIAGHTLAAASSREKPVADQPDIAGSVARAELVGKLVGERAKAVGIASVVFDRNGFLYHGRVKAVSDGAREAGLKF
jgi:large subunit ribosomal protein L18